MRDNRSPQHSEPSPPYTALAAGYDFVMSHVDYLFWAEYVQQMIERHNADAHRLLELGCGTGSLAVILQPLGPYRYVATDRSDAMLSVARSKAEVIGASIHFRKADFADYRSEERFDVAILLFDGLNYLLKKQEVRGLLACTYDALVEGGIFIVDQSTPANSVNNERYFESSDRQDDFAYVRRSRFEAGTSLHRTTLEIIVGDRTYREEHVQRAYAIDEIRGLTDDVGFHVDAAYDGFSFDEASDGSERVHWVLRRPG